VLDAATLDTVLRAGALDTPGPTAVKAGPTLATVLRADPAAPLEAALVERVLAAVAYGPTAAGTGATAAIGADGSFVLGPLAGRAAKAEAEHLGASARAARRARRLAEIRAELEVLAGVQDKIAARLARLVERATTLNAELAGFPPAAALHAALRSLGVAVAVEARARGEHEQAEAEATRHVGVLIAAQAEQREHSVAHGLPPALDDDALLARREACSELVAVVGGIARELDALVLAREALAGRRERQAELTARAAERDRSAAAAEEQAARLAAEHAAREAALGQEGASLRRRHAEVTAALDALRDARRAATAALSEVHDAAREAARDMGDAEAERDATRAVREDALVALRALAVGGLLAAALDQDAPADAAEAPDWPLTRRGAAGRPSAAASPPPARANLAR